MLEVHPELESMYAEHLELLDASYRKDGGDQVDIPALQEQCSALAHQIVEIERSVDLG